jgi:hypothetical protein
MKDMNKTITEETSGLWDGGPQCAGDLGGGIRKVRGQIMKECYISLGLESQSDELGNSLGKSNSAAKGSLWEALIQKVARLSSIFRKPSRES